MPASSNIERALGIVVGKLEGIEKRLERQDESRAVLHQRLDDVVLRMTHVEVDVTSLRNRTDAMEEVTSQVETMRQRAIGAGTLGRWMLAVGSALLGAAGGAAAVYTKITGWPPP